MSNVYSGQQPPAPTASRRHQDLIIVGITRPITEFYSIGDKLGSGQYGQVYSGYNLATKEQVAIKCIDKSNFSHADPQYSISTMRNEISIMRSIHHPNVIRLYDVYETIDKLYLVLEACHGGELFDRIKSKKQYTERDAQIVLRQACDALSALHDKKIAHCDLKPDNFLFATSDDTSRLVLIDFGMSKALGRFERLRGVRGTPYYISPEVLDGNFTESADMWSLGVVLFVMLFGFPPFHGSDDQVYKGIRKGFDPVVKPGWGAWFPEAMPCSAGAKDLISRLLTHDSIGRLTAREVLSHPWTLGHDLPAQPRPASVLSNLDTLIAKNKFSNAMLAWMTQSTMDINEYTALARTFRYIDKDGDGTLTIDEFKTAMRETEGINIDENELTAIIKSADMDGDGKISWRELLLSTTARKLVAKEERLLESFRRLDLNGDNMLSIEELSLALGKEIDEIKNLIKDVDVNHDGLVDYDEFISIFSKFSQQQQELFAQEVMMDSTTNASPSSHHCSPHSHQ